MNKIILAEDIDLNGVNLILEITRFCNMTCPHCLRGDMQRLRIKKEYIDAALSQIDYIDTIMFSGGEPSLATDLINYTLKYCRHHNKEVQNFWMATNGSVTKRSFLSSIENWVKYCSDNEASGLRVSIDMYHDWIDKFYFEEFREMMEYEVGKQFYIEYCGAPDDPKYLYSEGRAKENYNAGKKTDHELHFYDGKLDAPLYINAKGFIMSSCDLSYKSMDVKNSKFVIGHISEDIKENLAIFFNKHSELIGA